MSVNRYPQPNSPASLQLLLFLDEHVSSYAQNQEIRTRLARLNKEQTFEIRIINVSKQPDLAEHYRVIATPALVKLYPPPHQILAGSNLIEQIDNWWEHWQGDLASVEGGAKYDRYPATEMNDRATLPLAIEYLYSNKKKKSYSTDSNCKIERFRY